MMEIGRYKIGRKEVIIFLSAAMVVFTLYCLAWLPPSGHIQRGIFLSLITITVSLLYPRKSKIGKVCMVLFTSMALAGSIYPILFEDRLLAQLLQANETDVYIFVIFIIGFSAVLASVAGGHIILGIIVLMLSYMLLGHHMPGLFSHVPFPLNFITSVLYIDLDIGAFGMFADLACRVLSIFIIFTALLITSGLGDLATAMATWVAGNATGGPAKVSVFSSAAYGMLSGSAIANVAATGSFTIPMMKKVGYKPSAAATVEALASTGGGLMPPVMATACFIMADMLGIPYIRVCVAALIPVFLWYFTVYFVVHYYALRQGIMKWRPPREEVMKVIRAKFHLVFAVFALVGALFYFVAAEQGAFWAVVFLLISASLRKGTRLTKAKVVEFLEAYATMFAPLFILLIALGMVVAAMVGSGIHIKIGILLLGGIEQWYFIVLITAAFTIALGMAVPNIAAYLAAIVIVLPILAKLGYNLLVIHMFVFYIANIAPITPPVCLASFTAARIAGSDMMKTGLEATIKSLPLWIIPFAIFKKGLLFGIGTPLSALGIGVAILCLGIFIFVLGTEGYFQRRLKWGERILAIVIGIMIVQPVSDSYSYIFTVAGILLLAYWYLPHLFEKARVRKVQGN
jgi:TRAP transporter 4TM/12TM fusion protein